jgi:mannitol-1-phosphate/altronate dehydrogenase
MILSNTTVRGITDAIKKPTYERSTLAPSLVHIGLGHFHRAHFLTYLDTLNNAGDAHDGVFEVDIPPANETFTKNLREQDYLYSVLSWGSDGSKDIRINGPIIGYANATKEPGTVLEKLSAPETKLISLTITEKGYYYLDDEQTLNWDNERILHDLEATDSYPATPVGYLSRALLKRKETNSPVTIMSCDNIPENGKVLKCCILQFCDKKYPEIVSWVEKNVAFPCTMVDRITPGTTQSDIETIEEAGSYHDNCPVHCEDFLQWVIEDSHTTDIPDFAKAGAMVVKDVKPYELMKIRLLNGSHSALSYPAYLMGILTVDEAATNPLIHDFIRNHYMEELTATLPQVPGIDVTTYKDKLLNRFSNVYISDTILRLASDGSKKIANAIAKPLQETIGTKKKHEAMILSLAFWARFCSGIDENGKELPIDDPQREVLLKTWNKSEEFLRNIGITNGLEDLAKELAVALKAIEEEGTKQVLTDFLK